MKASKHNFFQSKEKYILTVLQNKIDARIDNITISNRKEYSNVSGFAFLFANENQNGIHYRNPLLTFLLQRYPQ